MLQHLLAPQVIMAFTRLLAGNSIMLNLLSSPKHVQLGEALAHSRNSQEPHCCLVCSNQPYPTNAQQALDVASKRLQIRTVCCCGYAGQRSVVVAAAAGGGANKSSRRRRSSSLIDQQELKDVFLDTSQQLQPVSSRRRRKLAAVQQGQAPKQQLHPQEVFNTWQQQEPQPQQQPQQQGNLDQLLENTQQLGAMQASQVSSDTTTSAAAAGSLDASSDTISSTFLHSSGSGQPNSSRQEAASSRHDNHQHAHAITAAAAYRQQQASSSNVRSIDQHSDEDSDTNSSASYEGGWDFVYRISDEVQAAISRITRFLDFRERCASEVLTKLYSLGYSRDLSREVLFALQKAVSSCWHAGTQQLQ